MGNGSYAELVLWKRECPANEGLATTTGRVPGSHGESELDAASHRLASVVARLMRMSKLTVDG